MKVVQKWDIPFSAQEACTLYTPAVLFTPFRKPPKIFLPTPLANKASAQNCCSLIIHNNIQFLVVASSRIPGQIFRLR